MMTSCRPHTAGKELVAQLVAEWVVPESPVPESPHNRSIEFHSSTGMHKCRQP
jgi:hypothetical protein